MIERETGCSSADAAGFLEGVEGGHFADGVVAAVRNGVGLESAIKVTAARWMAWDIDAETARGAGLCPGLPLLLASVIALRRDARVGLSNEIAIPDPHADRIEVRTRNRL
jgi:hypothetical protein